MTRYLVCFAPPPLIDPVESAATRAQTSLCGGGAFFVPLTGAVLVGSAAEPIGGSCPAFGSLWLSSHPGTSSMGKLLALSLICTLAAAALFQPVLMGKPRQVDD